MSTILQNTKFCVYLLQSAGCSRYGNSFWVLSWCSSFWSYKDFEIWRKCMTVLHHGTVNNKDSITAQKQGVVTYILPVEVLATWIKNLDWWKLSLIAWSLQRTRAPLPCFLSIQQMCWSVDISCSEVILIPWSAPKRNVDYLISFSSQSGSLPCSPLFFYLGCMPAS